MDKNNVRFKLQGVPKNMGIQWRIWCRLCHNIIMSARVYFMKRVKDCEDVSIMSPQDEQWRRTSLLCFSCFTKYNRMQSKHNKQNVNIADETLTNYSFLSRYHCHYTKSKNYSKRQYRLRHWIPMFIGTPCKRSNCPMNMKMKHSIM